MCVYIYVYMYVYTGAGCAGEGSRGMPHAAGPYAAECHWGAAARGPHAVPGTFVERSMKDYINISKFKLVYNTWYTIDVLEYVA